MPGRLVRHQHRGRDGHGEEAGPGSTVVTILCDYGNRYLSKLYNGAFLKEKGLPAPDWYEG